jgi:Calcineurin-like phosphoesterase
MPPPASVDAPWWSYDVGLVHLIGISTEHNYTTGSPQWLWLKDDLESINRTITPWVIFGGHRAMYLNSNYEAAAEVECSTIDENNYSPYVDCSSPLVPGTSDVAVMDLMIEHLEPLINKYKVDIGFYGHNHVVQRHSAVYNRTVVQAAEKVIEDGNEEFTSPAMQIFVMTFSFSFSLCQVKLFICTTTPRRLSTWLLEQQAPCLP